MDFNENLFGTPEHQGGPAVLPQGGGAGMGLMQLIAPLLQQIQAQGGAAPPPRGGGMPLAQGTAAGRPAAMAPGAGNDSAIWDALKGALGGAGSYIKDQFNTHAAAADQMPSNSAPQAAVPSVPPPTPQPIPTRPSGIPAPSANGAGAPYGSAAAGTTSPASPDNSTELLGDVPGGTATQLQGDAQDPMMGAVKALQGVKPPPAPDMIKPSTPGAPQAKPMESGLMDILMMNQKMREARTMLPQFSQMIGR